mgnify:CR=1 FL=1
MKNKFLLYQAPIISICIALIIYVYIYDKDDFYRSINSSEFYNWVVSTKNNFVHLMSVMEFTKTQMVKVESKLKKVIED